MGCGVSKQKGPTDRAGAARPRGVSIADLSPTELQTWLVHKGLSKQALSLEGFDGASLLSATDQELSEVDGLSSPLLRRSLLNRIRLHEEQVGGVVVGSPAPTAASKSQSTQPCEEGSLEERGEAVADRVLDRVEAVQGKMDAKKEELEGKLAEAKVVGNVAAALSPDEVRNVAVKVLEKADGVLSLVEGAAEAALSAAEELPLVGGACRVLHQMYRAVKRARGNRKACEKFGETLKTLEAVILKAARLESKAVTLGSLEDALKEAAEFLEEQSTQGWLRRMLLGESSADKFQDLQAKIMEELRMVQAETILDVAGGVEKLLFQAEALRKGSAVGTEVELEAKKEGEVREAIRAKVEELGGWSCVRDDPAKVEAVAALLGVDQRVLSAEISTGFIEMKKSVTKLESDLADIAESGPHVLIKHKDAQKLWAKKFRGLQKVMSDLFAVAILDAQEEKLVPKIHPELDHAGSISLADAVDVDRNGHITVVEMRSAFPRGLSFAECVAQLMATGGTISLPMPPKNFLGRDSLLDNAMLAWRKAAALVVVAPGGVGKSAFGVMLARRAVDEGDCSSAVFADMRNATTVPAFLSSIGHACRVNIEGVDPLPLFHWAGKLSKTTLVLVDNAEDAMNLRGDEGEDDVSLVSTLSRMLRSAPPGRLRLLITSRVCVPLQDNAATFPLEPLTPQEAARLVLLLAPSLDAKDAEKIAERCGYSPVKMQALAAAVDVGAITLDFAKEETFSESTENPHKVSDVPDKRVHRIVSEVSRKFNALQTAMEAAPAEVRAAMMSLTVIPTAFDDEAASAILGCDAKALLQAALNAGLLDHDAVNGKYKMHLLVRDVALAACSPAGSPPAHAWCQFVMHTCSRLRQVIDLYTSKNGSTPALALFDEERASFDAMLNANFAYLDREALVVVASSITIGGQEADGGLLQARMLLSDMERIFSSVSTSMLHFFGKEHLLTSKVLHCLAGVYDLQGRYDLARSLHVQNLDIVLKCVGEDDDYTIRVLNGLAGGHWYETHNDEAEKYYLRALTISERMYGKHHKKNIDSLVGTACTYDRQERYEEALVVYERCLAICLESYGDDHPVTAEAFNNMANVYSNQLRNEEALKMYGRALAVYQKEMGEDHTHTAITLFCMAIIHKRQGRADQALAEYGRALEIQRKRLGDAHVDTVETAESVIEIYEEIGRVQDAEKLKAEMKL